MLCFATGLWREKLTVMSLRHKLNYFDKAGVRTHILCKLLLSLPLFLNLENTHGRVATNTLSFSFWFRSSKSGRSISNTLSSGILAPPSERGYNVLRSKFSCIRRWFSLWKLNQWNIPGTSHFQAYVESGQWSLFLKHTVKSRDSDDQNPIHTKFYDPRSNRKKETNKQTQVKLKKQVLALA